YAAVAVLPLTPDAELYLGALSQRMVTPTHGLGLIEPTPPRGVPTMQTPVPRMGQTSSGAAPVRPQADHPAAERTAERPAAAFDPGQAETALGVATPPPRPAMTVPPATEDGAIPETEEDGAEHEPPAGGTAPAPTGDPAAPPSAPETGGQEFWRRIPIVDRKS